MLDGVVGKAVVISGGAQGIGYAAAGILIQSGCSVLIADINDEAGREAVAGLQAIADETGAAVAFTHADVTQEDEVEAMVDFAVRRFGKLDGAINQAVFLPRGVAVHEMTTEQWDASYAVNLRGQFLCLKYQIAAMLQGGGSIVGISSSAAVKGFPGSADYCAMKSGLNGLVRAAAADHVGNRIRVNAIMPGPTDTPGHRAAGASNPKFGEIMLALPIGRAATATEVGSLAAWLMSDHAAYTTGAAIPVDGGMTAF